MQQHADGAGVLDRRPAPQHRLSLVDHTRAANHAERTVGGQRGQHLRGVVVRGLRERHPLLDVRAEARLLERRAHAQQHALGAERPRAQDRLAQRLPVRAVRARQRVVEPDDHRRVVPRADEVRAEGRHLTRRAQPQRHQLPRRVREQLAQEALRQRERVEVATTRLHRQVELVEVLELGVGDRAPAAAQELDLVRLVERQHGLALVHARLRRQLRHPLRRRRPRPARRPARPAARS